MAAQSTARSSTSTVMATGAALLTIAAAVVFLTKMRKDRQDKKNASSTAAKSGFAADPQLTSLFEAAAEESKELNQISNTEKLILYSLYKQSKEGDASDSKPPGFTINLVEKAKYAAWSRLKGMSKVSAMVHYIEAVQKLRTHGSVDNDDGSGLGIEGIDMIDDLPIGDGFGNAPSSLANNAEDSGDGYNGQDLTMAQKVLRAASQDNVTELKSILAQHPDLVNHRDEDGQSALHLAADKGATQALKVLIEAGADGNAADGDGITVLHAAVIAENLEACRLLLEHGANPDQRDVDGDTPRKCAQEDGSEDIKQLFASYSTTT